MSSVVPVIVPQGFTDSKVASIVSAAVAAHLVPQAIEQIQQEAMVFAIVTRWGGCRTCGMSTSSTIQKIGSCADSGKDARRRDLEELVSFTGVSRHRSTEV